MVRVEEKLMRAVALLSTVVLSVVLVGCGSDDDSDPEAQPGTPTVADSASESVTESESSSPFPDCADVWVDDATVPADYEGCMDAAGEVSLPQYGPAMAPCQIYYQPMLDGLYLAAVREGATIHAHGLDPNVTQAEFDEACG